MKKFWMLLGLMVLGGSTLAVLPTPEAAESVPVVGVETADALGNCSVEAVGAGATRTRCTFQGIGSVTQRAAQDCWSGYPSNYWYAQRGPYATVNVYSTTPWCPSGVVSNRRVLT